MEKKLKILSIDKNHPLLNNSLRKIGFLVDELYDDTKTNIEKIIMNYIGVIIRSRFVLDKEFLKKANNLKFIARVGSGIENIDYKFAKNRGIKVINCPEGNRDSLAEHTLGMLLTLLHRIKISDFQIRNGIWKREENRGDELMNKTIGIIGYGVMGNAFAKRLIGLDVSVLCYDILPNKSNRFAHQVDLEEIFQKCEVISLHLPQNESTKHFVDNKFISSMYHSFYLINTARGDCINTTDLVSGLRSKKIKGACLDVIEFETSSFEDIEISQKKQDFNYLLYSNNVILTPHIAGWSFQSNQRMAEIIIDKIKKFFKIL